MINVFRILNDKGRKEYSDWVNSIRDKNSDHLPTNDIPLYILSDASTSIGLPQEINFPNIEPSTKLDFINGLIPVIDKLRNIDDLDKELWPGIWDSFALRYFDCICPKDDLGFIRFAPWYYCYQEKDYNHYYRHLIYGTYSRFKIGGEFVAPFYNSSPSVSGEYSEQIGANAELGHKKNVLELCSRLFVKNGAPIAGYTSTDKPGSLRRLVTVLKQYDRNYDIADVSIEGLLSLLPDEFDHWQSA
tara:strand:- start:63 stop:797 length:735 start_codon:yes stop_codon:yes gene_type:complete